MKNYGMPFNNTAIDKMSGKFGKGEPEPKMRVQTTKEVTVKPKKKGPVSKMGEFETRLRASMIKVGETVFGAKKEHRTPHEQRILNKDMAIYKKNRLEDKKQEVRDNFQKAKNRLKVEALQKKGYNKSGF